MTLTPANDIVGKKPGRGLTGLLLVAVPVLLVFWMIIWPIISAIGRTLWLPNDGGTGRSFSLETYVFFFSDQYSVNNLTVTLWTTGVCALLLGGEAHGLIRHSLRGSASRRASALHYPLGSGGFGD